MEEDMIGEGRPREKGKKKKRKGKLSWESYSRSRGVEVCRGADKLEVGGTLSILDSRAL